MKNHPRVLLVNPWIHDFAAYDYWAQPFGLLTLAALLRLHGYAVSYIDCLDRFHPRGSVGDPADRHGRGPYLKTRIPKPEGLGDIPRHYSRYGIKPEWFREDLAALPRPDLVLVTSVMTYWYPGVKEVIGILKERLPDVPLVLGGIYATLCPEHARLTTGADLVFTGPAEHRLLSLAGEFTGYFPGKKFAPDDLDTYPAPAFDLQHRIGYIPLLTSKGCPFDCAYCAAKTLNPKRMTRSPKRVVAEIVDWRKKWDVDDFVFYDDALLANPDHHAALIFEGVVRSGLKVRFHTPNALHIRWISGEVADLMKRAGFETIRLGLETVKTDHGNDHDPKVSLDEFHRAVGCLKAAGFDSQQIGVYLLAGLPGQSPDEVAASIRTVKNSGARPVLAHYTPIPHTALWPAAVAASRYDLEADPVFTNNAVFPCQATPFSWKMSTDLKILASDGP